MYKLVQLLLKIFAKFVKKEQKYLIFESANNFYDNAFALYQYVKKNFPEWPTKYVVGSRKMMKLGKLHNVKKSEMIYCRNKLKLYRYSLKAKCIFFSYTNYWRKLKLQPETRVVYTAHGEFPVKDCTKYYDYLFGGIQENKLDIIIRTEYAKNILLKKYPIFNKHNHTIAGMPRNDIMFHANLDKEDFLKKIGVNNTKNKKIIISMTTFRYEHVKDLDYFKEEFPISLTHDDLNELNELLEKNNEILLIKLHHSQDGVIMPENLDNIIFLTEQMLCDIDVTINRLYSICDSLITDYSSAYLSFLDLDRKVGFILTDKEKYSKLRGWTIDNVEEMMPGDKIYTKEELYSFFKSLNSNEDPYKEKRREVKLKFAGDYGDQNCKSYTDVYLK